MRLVGGLKNLMHLQHFLQYLVHNKCSVRVRLLVIARHYSTIAFPHHIVLLECFTYIFISPNL